MKNKQKARRRCAWAGAVLLCILSIFASLMIPVGASAIDGLNDPPDYYITLYWDSGSNPDLAVNHCVYILNLSSVWYFTYKMGGEIHRVSSQSNSDFDYFSIEQDSSGSCCINISGTFLAISDGTSYTDRRGTEFEWFSIAFDPYLDQDAFNELLIVLPGSGANVTIPDGQYLLTEGYNQGYNNGYSDGEEAHYDDYQTGYIDGETSGYNAGKADGYISGYNEGLTNGYNSGLVDGEALHVDDYKNGFAAGQTDAMNSTSSLKDMIFSIFSAPADLINGILDFDLFGINVASLVKTLITLAVTALIVVFLIKLMRR